MRVVCISDTHSLHDQVEIPDGDLLIHAGDFCNHGTRGEAKRFLKWFGSLPHQHKVFIAGNHDWPFYKHRKYVKMWVKDHATYLIDNSVTINGLKIWGTPWQPEFCNWAFNLPRGPLLASVWERIPADTDILITHTPPAGILDNDRIGCEDLTKRLKSLSPKLHVFGHSHAGAGQLEQDGTRFINACICDPDYEPCNPPIVVEL